MNLTPFDKALFPPIVAFIIAALSSAGIAPDMTVEQLVTVLVQGVAGGVGVYLARNRAA